MHMVKTHFVGKSVSEPFLVALEKSNDQNSPNLLNFLLSDSVWSVVIDTDREVVKLYFLLLPLEMYLLADR